MLLVQEAVTDRSVSSAAVKLPTAHALLPETAVMPRRLLAMPSLGLGTLVQALPFQCSIRVFWPVLTLLAPVLPTAHAFEGDSAATPLNWPPPAGAWKCWIVQRAPFQCSMTGWVCAGMPGPGPARPT